jgi:hypothetical protein
MHERMHATQYCAWVAFSVNGRRCTPPSNNRTTTLLILAPCTNALKEWPSQQQPLTPPLEKQIAKSSALSLGFMRAANGGAPKP